MQPGTYHAKTNRGAVYETEGGALMVAFPFVTENQENIVGRFCLASKAGEVQQNTVRNLREAFGWDGADPFWLVDTDLSEKDVDIVVENEDDKNGKPQPRVKWVNAPGGAHGMPQNGDRKAILAKYGAKFRALTGGTPLKPAPKPAPAPTAPPAATKPAPAKAACAMGDAWSVFCEHAGTAWTQDGLAKAWWDAIKAMTGKNGNDDCAPEDWAVVRDGCKAWLAQQMPY